MNGLYPPKHPTVLPFTPKPGLVPNLPNDTYHSLTDWYSSSQLKSYLPEDYKQGGSQDALDFGNLVHTVVLEPDKLNSGYVLSDPAKIGVKADGTKADNPTNTTAWKRHVADVKAAGKIAVSPADWDKAHRMRDAYASHPEAAELLFGSEGVNEESAFAVDEHGIRHKARFDRRIPGAPLLDVKSTASQPGSRHLTSAVINYGYELSAAHYLTVAELLGLDVTGFTLLFCDKSDDYRVTVCDLDDLLLMRGRYQRDRALERALGRDEPYEGATGRLTLTCPGWALPYDDEMVM